MIKHIGNRGNLAFFSNETRGVSINLDLNIVVASGDVDFFTSKVWYKGGAPEESYLLASAALDAPITPIVASSTRMYTIVSH